MNQEQFRMQVNLDTYQWMVYHWELWEKLCAVHGDDSISPHVIMIVIRFILDAKLYPLLFVFLTNYQHVKPLNDILQQTLHSRIIATWQDDALELMAVEIMTRLKEAENRKD
ncbi:MAG: hypothetical protein LIO46_07125 [Clostridiales bacterium]|nr:hypothetical protein [Clostridiales bacterium]